MVYGAPRMRVAALKQEQIGYPQGQSLFIAPDSTPMPMGERALSFGRRQYKWHADPKAFTIGAEMLGTPEERARVRRGINVAADTYVRHDGVIIHVQSGEVQRTTDLGDAPLPYVPASVRAAVCAGERAAEDDAPEDDAPGAGTVGTATVQRPARTAVQRDARERVIDARAAEDARIRATLARLTGRPYTGAITAAHRARFKDYAEESRQRAEMLSA